MSDDRLAITGGVGEQPKYAAIDPELGHIQKERLDEIMATVRDAVADVLNEPFTYADRWRPE